MQKITSCIWLDDRCEEAANFYISLFPNSELGRVAYYGASSAKASGQKVGSVLTVEFELAGQKILGLNGGPIFKFSPAHSYFVWCETESEIDTLWKSLSVGGTARFELGPYPWASRYGWTTDRYGVQWQLMLKENKQKMATAFLFVDQLFGRGEEALNFYISIFKNSKIDFIARDESTKSIAHCVFSLAGQEFVLMEGQGKHGHAFTHAYSLVVPCDTQDEIDFYYSKLSEGGATEPCGWLKDKFGVSWQVVPACLNEMTQNPKKSESMMKALLKMKKLDLKTLQDAYDSG